MKDDARNHEREDMMGFDLTSASVQIPLEAGSRKGFGESYFTPTY
jgi:hypothetical protein